VGHIAGHNFPINVGQTERMVSMVVGGPLVLYGLARRSVGGLLLAAVGGDLLYRGVTGHSPLYHALGIDRADVAQGRQVSVPYEQGVRVEESIVVKRPRDEVFHFWHNFENLPTFMRHLESVEVVDARRSHWVAKGPAGTKVEWDAEIINEDDEARIGWRSLPGSEVANAGSVQFRDAADGGTEIQVEMEYKPPAGLIGAGVARLLGEEPAVQIREDLHRFKEVMESRPTA
jgi:uncharacterized membrane protein